MSFNSDFIEIFIEECYEFLSDWEKTCMELDKNFTQKNINALFRYAHNIKGSSKAVGLDDFGNFVHKVEDVIVAVKESKLIFDSNISKLFLQSQSILQNWIDGISEDPTFIPENIGEITKYIKSLDLNVENSEKEQNQQAVEFTDFTEFKDEETSKNQNIPEKIPPPVLEDDKKISPKNSSSRSKTLRVNTEKIESLMQLVGELSIQLSIIKHTKEKHDYNSSIYEHATTLASKLIKDVQGQTLSLRMQPLNNLFQRLERVALDISKDLNKNIEIEVTGEDVELDKTVIESIIDPFVHLMRNCVDHGIESLEQRKKANKPENGSIKIQALQDTSGIEIIISDDGNGLDKDKILEKALKNSLAKPNVTYSESEIFNFILKPGFSTKETVTGISGRGVGMDVLGTALIDVGGKLEIESQLGKGSLFRIKLPTSLSIVDSLIVEVGTSEYAIPIQDLAEIVDLVELEQQNGTNKGKLLLRGNIIPVQPLAGYLPVEKMNIEKNTKFKSENPPSPGLITSLNGSLVAFKVDRISGQQPVVVRKLKGQMNKIPGISGSTIFGNGEPGLIVSLTVLAKIYLDKFSKRAV